MPLIRAVAAAVIVLAAVASSEAAEFEKVLTFVQADQVRIVSTLKGDQRLDNVEISGRIVGQDGKVLWQGALGDEGLDGTSPLVVQRTIDQLSPRVWSPHDPFLYQLTVTAAREGQAIAEKTVRFGFRSFTSEDGQFRLNSKPIFLRGLAINPPGRTIPQDVGHSRAFAESYVRYLRGQNINIIRLEPESQVWFDVCDELGMMVFQGPYGAPPAGPGEGGNKNRVPDDVARSVDGYKAIFENYLHHPSIVIYVMSNELPYTGNIGRQWHAFLTDAHARLKEWFPSQLFIGNAGYGEGKEGDINDVHRYWGWYYNTFLTYYNLRDPHLFGDSGKVQPFTFSECVGAFTGPLGSFNLIERKQVAAAMNWTGYSERQVEDAQAYQAFIVKHATESFRRLRPINPRLSGLMPFTIGFHNWRGIRAFEQMKPTAGMLQFGVSYQPVLLSWELWTGQVYAGTSVRAIAHVINDADDFSDLSGATLAWTLSGANGRKVLDGRLDLPDVPYYGTWSGPIEIALPAGLATGEYTISGQITRGGKVVSQNTTPLFVAGRDWNKPRRVESPVHLYDPAGETAAAMKRLNLAANVVGHLSQLSHGGVLVIGQEAWDDALAKQTQQLQQFVRRGGRVLILAQDHERFDPAWLPAKIEMLSHSASLPEYLGPRPTRDHMHLNPQRPGHPVLEGVDRARLRLWSDYTGWDQTRDGFPAVYPVTRGFRFIDESALKNTAVYIDYDRGLEGLALVEMFDGEGSVIVTGLDLVSRIGLDPVADRMLGNLVSYAASRQPRHVYQLVQRPIKWGDYASMQGVLSGPIQGLFINTRWAVPPTEPNAEPLPKSEGAWNTRPGDHFVAYGVRPRGPFGYSNSTSPRDIGDDETGSGIFYVRIPPGRRTIITKVENPTNRAQTLAVQINGSETGQPARIEPGRSAVIRSRIPTSTSELGIRYSGHRQLVITETAFE